MKTQITKLNKSSWFTLVELIVVVTILSILSTIWFVSYSSYLSWVRDTNRISQLKAIWDSLHLYETKKSLPLPDEKRLEIKDWATTIAIQWYVWKSVIETIWYTSEGKDPKDNTYFSYYLTKDRKYFQLLSFLEDQPETISKLNNLNKLNKLNNLKTTQAIDYENRYPYVYWKKLWILTTDSNEPIQEIHSGSLDISNVWNTKIYKSYLKTNELLIWNWTIFKDLWKLVKWWWRWYSASWNTIVYVNLDWGLSSTIWTNLSTPPSSTPSTPTPTPSTPTPSIPTDWRSVDTNCDIADIKLWTQTWAWCNSTLWNGIEWWKKDNWTNWTIHSSYWCYKNHQWTNNRNDCAIGSSQMRSTTKSNTWFTGTNSNWDKAPSNIWWKLYTWDNAKNTACKNWYHLPSDQEWTILENYLAWRTCRTWDWYQCDGLWWKNHTNKSSKTNIVKELMLPLAGYRNSDGSTFYYRGDNTYLLSSSLNGSYARGRYFHRYNSSVYRFYRLKTYGFSVRCIKD